MVWQQTPYVLPLIIAGAVSIGLAAAVWHRHRGTGTTAFVALMLGLTIWTWAYALEISTSTLSAQLFWAKAAYVGIGLTPTAWLVLVLKQTGIERWVTWRNTGLLMIVPTLTLLIVGTNELHGLFWSGLSQSKVDTYSVFDPSPGVWFWINTTYMYSLIIVGAVLLVRTLLRSNSVYRGQAGSLLASLLPPWVANIVSISGVSPFPGLDITPFAFTITGTAMAWGMLRFGLMDMLPIARDAIIEGMKDGIMVMDNKGRVLDINPSAHKIIRQDFSEVIGNPAEILLADNPELLEACLARGNPGIEISVDHDDATLYYDVQTSRIHDRRGRNAGKVVIFRDITKRKLVEEALRLTEAERQASEHKHLSEQLQQAQKMESVGRLTSGVAHDFNNLITGILGYTQLCMLALPPENEKVRRDLEEINKTATRASSLTHQLLAFARRQASEPQVFCLNDVILEMDKMLRRLIGEDVELITRTSTEPANIEADPGKIEQIIVNLIVNARDAVPSGGEIVIETSLHTLSPSDFPHEPRALDGRYVLLSVSDTGIGISEDVKAKVFEPFFTTKAEGKGTGLGLSTCSEIVQESGGFIMLDSSLGRGTTFSIYLPLVDMPNTTNLAPIEFDDIAPGTETILLVEDESLVRDVTASMLRDQGYNVMEASGGTDALELALTYTQGYIHLLLSDIVMPGMGGKELAAHFNLIHPESKVLYTSGYTDEILESHGVDYTKVAFLQKPFSADTLARSVRDVLDSPFDEAELSELVESPR